MAQYMGAYVLPRLTNEDVAALKKKEYHKLNDSPHVEAMRQLIIDGAAVDPTHVNGVVLATPLEGRAGDPTHTSYIHLTDDGDTVGWQFVTFLGGNWPEEEIENRLNKADRTELMQMRGEYQARPIKRLA